MNLFTMDAFQNSPIGIAKCKLIFDKDGNPFDFEFIEINQALIIQSGLNKEQLTNLKLTSFSTTPKTKQWWLNFFHQAAIQKQKVETSKHLSITGKWHKVYAWPAEEEMFYFAAIDITKDKEHEKTIINKSHEKINAFLKAFPDLIFIADQKGNIVEYNFENNKLLFNFVESEPIGHISQIIPSEFQEQLIEKINESLQSKSNQQAILTLGDGDDAPQFEARFVPSEGDEVLVIIKDISAQTAILNELERRDKVLQAIADASQALLSNISIDQAVDQALSIIGKATRQDRVYVFEVHPDIENGQPLMSQRYEWTNEGIQAEIDNPDLQNIPMLEIAPRWHKTLSDGGFIVGNIADFPQTERTPLEAQSIVSLLVVPIQIEEQFWGFVGFDDCSNTAQWKSADVAILRSLASNIGNAIIRDRNKQELINAKQLIANREERYRLVMENLTDAIGIIRSDGTYSGFTNAIEKITGYKATELINKSLHEIIHPDDFEKTMKVFKMTFEKPNNTYEHQLRIIHKKNQWVDVEAKGRNLTDKNSIKGLLVSIREITDRKKAEEALIKSEEKYRLVAENTSDGILILDGNNEMIWASPAYVQQLGFTNETLPHINADFIYNNIHPEDRDELFSNIFQAIKDKVNVESYTYRAKHTEGHYIWLEDKTHFIYNDDGTLLSTNIISRDITERKEAEAHLIESENKFRAITETANDAIIVADESGTITFCNPVFEKIFGYSKQEMLGQKIETLLPDTFKAKHLELYAQFQKNNQHDFGKIVENQAKHKNGHLFPVEVSLSAWKSDGKQITSAQVRDISERKQAEQSINLLTKAVTQSPVSIIITDAGGTIEYVNPKFCEVSGFSSSELMGKNPSFLMAESTKEHVYKELWSTISQGKTWTGEMENRKKDGSLFWENVSISPITNKEGTITHYIAVKEDITHLKAMMENLIKAKEQAEASDKLKTAFMNNISHEIRTPLNHILGFSHMLVEPDVSSAEKKEFYSIIKKGSDRLLETINNYMDIALIASGNMKVYPKSFLFSDILTKVENKFRQTCIDKKLMFNINNDGIYESPVLYSDDEILTKIIAHLTDNAIKFTQQGHVCINYKIQSKLIEINISDTGIGIEDAKKEIIFSAFAQAETSDTRGHEGSGLGLTIARHLTELLGGELNLKSSTISGTTISILLPLNYGTKLDHLTTAVAPNKIPKLLIVEDHPESRQFLSALLSKQNYTLILAFDGEDALKKIQEDQDIDLVIMDIKLPKMDGLEATKRIKAIRAELPVIAVTANALSDDREKALSAGCNAYLSKPVDKVQLINKIKQLL